ncbi:hypothetical protein [Sphingomonas colocasiae]|uniref:Uncharacterized protein n=1 Tax=Sphingomonas colocasiae TaxID=1848973 RepID=A0ABS7PVA9_9SPHN|nr:hypothetical protein [Sphingomonas colocasiae]MBY8825297.1 hypothetical protein [Sphingomonas colocasiae]
MDEKNSGELSSITIRLEGKEDAAPICNMLRGLLLASGVELKGITNGRLLRGHTVAFDTAAVAEKFVSDLGALFSQAVLDRLEIGLHGQD